MSDTQLRCLLELLQGRLGNLVQSASSAGEMPANINVADAQMRKMAGVIAQKYDGCIKCHGYVWDQKDKDNICPFCGGHRYDVKGNPHEQVIHFPLKPRLEALLRDSVQFQEAVEYEKYRKCPREKHKGVMAGMCFCVNFLCSYLHLFTMHICADVFDTPRWKEMVDEKNPDTLVLRLLGCVDGIQPFKCNGETLMPFEFLLLSFAPWLRYKVNNMFIYMLIPSSLTPESQRKYFTKVVQCDLNPMMRDGLHVPNLDYPVKVKIFGQVHTIV